jgi:hypothetical protein
MPALFKEVVEKFALKRSEIPPAVVALGLVEPPEDSEAPPELKTNA